MKRKDDDFIFFHQEKSWLTREKNLTFFLRIATLSLSLSLSLSCTVFDSFMLHHNYFVSLLFWVNILVSLVKTTSGK